MALNAEMRELAMTLLIDAVNADPHGKSGVSKRLGKGCGRSLLSRVLSPNDACEMSESLAHSVLETYHVIRSCPATQAPQPISECQRLSAGRAPTHNPQAMRIWKTCQTCIHKPKPVGEKS